ncbi:hypothetical protein GGR58DRAFT_496773 [Xylaria digitata]|nr:hypothetical protein GGR58DRAFT_496773 [Xylaria digitata]
MADHGMDSGDCNNTLEPQEKSQALTDSLYDGPLDHIIRNHPELFVYPWFWTRRHARFLHVDYKEEEPRIRSFSQHLHLTNKHDQHGDSAQGADISTPQSKDGKNILRVPSFTLPYIATPYLNRYIKELSTHGNEASRETRLPAMETLLVWKKQQRQRYLSTLMNSKMMGGKSRKSPNRDSNNGAYIRHRLKVKNNPLYIAYGKRERVIVPSSRTYTLVKDVSYASRHSWRLIYLDRSQFNHMQKRRRRMMAERLRNEISVEAEDAAIEWSPNEGRMAGLFIAMAQQRRREIDLERQSYRSFGIDPLPSPQLQARYQILLTDNGADRVCMYLYTAHVSDFLLEHFRNPARLPQLSRPEHGQPLLKIHRATIPFPPYTSFRHRLRTVIMDLANGAVGGFFPDLKLQERRQDGMNIAQN